MKRFLSISILLAAFLLITSCMKENCGCDEKMVSYPPVLFQYEYYNYAWGFRHHGFMIDAHGNVNGFSQPENWVSPDSMGFISKSDLEHNLALCDTVSTTVSDLEVQTNYRRIESIRGGKIFDHGQFMADAGTGVLSAWYWNKRIGKYESVFLMSNGDIFKENSHPDVKAMVDWLKRIGEKTDRFYWFDGK
jgi:hypothetical protein